MDFFLIPHARSYFFSYVENITEFLDQYIVVREHKHTTQLSMTLLPPTTSVSYSEQFTVSSSRKW